jgi:hypothetical protein
MSNYQGLYNHNPDKTTNEILNAKFFTKEEKINFLMHRLDGIKKEKEGYKILKNQIDAMDIILTQSIQNHIKMIAEARKEKPVIFSEVKDDEIKDQNNNKQPSSITTMESKTKFKFTTTTKFVQSSDEDKETIDLTSDSSETMISEDEDSLSKTLNSKEEEEEDNIFSKQEKLKLAQASISFGNVDYNDLIFEENEEEEEKKNEMEDEKEMIVQDQKNLPVKRTRKPPRILNQRKSSVNQAQSNMIDNISKPEKVFVRPKNYIIEEWSKKKWIEEKHWTPEGLLISNLELKQIFSEWKKNIPKNPRFTDFTTWIVKNLGFNRKRTAQTKGSKNVYHLFL